MQAAAAEVAGDAGAPVELYDEPTPELIVAICDPSWPAAIRAERAALFARIPPPRRFAMLRVEGKPVAAGLCVRDADLAGLFSLRTLRAFRRRGYGSALLRALAADAHAAGAQRLYLQVEDDNPALALWGRFGFTPVYGYHYRELAGA
jgi:ribosomal protein S18 acetylase RimI-like enzyme